LVNIKTNINILFTCIMSVSILMLHCKDCSTIFVGQGVIQILYIT